MLEPLKHFYGLFWRKIELKYELKSYYLAGVKLIGSVFNIETLIYFVHSKMNHDLVQCSEHMIYFGTFYIYIQCTKKV